MQLVVQIPIIDLRQVTQTEEAINVWPSSDMSKIQVEEFMKKAPFIRNFGKISSGQEGYSCNINSIRCVNLWDKGFSVNNTAAPIFNTYKRLHADGVYTLKAEVGLSDQSEAMVKATVPDKPVHITDVLAHYMNMSLDVQDMGNRATKSADTPNRNDNIKGWTTVKMGDLGPVLAKNYCIATTKNKETQAAEEYVVNGEACITLTFVADEKILLPANAEKLDAFDVDETTIQLYGYKWNFEERTFKVWLFQLLGLPFLKSRAVILELQNRRINLFRLNAEKETMRILMNGFDTDNTNLALKNYIKKTPVKIFKKERFSKPQDGVRNFALQSEKGSVQFTTIEDLKKILDEYGLANLKNLEQNMKTAPQKKSVLFITSNPTDSNPIDFGEQFKSIAEALRSGTDRDYFTILPIAAGVERDKVMEILYTELPDYIHITLHANEIKGLYFQNSAKKTDPMPAEEFADYIKQLNVLKKPEAIILCACNSLTHAAAVKEHCTYAMGTKYVFPNDAAIIYAKKFFVALFNGKDVRFCHDVAVQGIKYNRPPFDAIDDNEVYNIPQLIIAGQTN